MSIWTHVVGNIRVDNLVGLSDVTVQTIREILGPVVTWENDVEETKLPEGSEGSLQYEIIEYADGLPWVTIPIWGDLRDYDDVEEIKQWFFKTLAELEFIRDAVICIQIEGRETVILTHQSKSE